MLKNKEFILNLIPVLEDQISTPPEVVAEGQPESLLAENAEELAVERGIVLVPEQLVAEAEAVLAEKIAAQTEKTYLSRLEALRYFTQLLIVVLPMLAATVALRLWQFNQVSPYMDETSYILTGRLFLEHGQIYANALHWTFGSYLYPLMVGFADQVGGLMGARYLSLAMNAVTVLAVFFMTFGLFKALPQSREQAIADFSLGSKPVMASLFAGLVVAVLPTAVALSRFATYDATAAAYFACGCAAFIWAVRQTKVATLHNISRTPDIMTLFAIATIFLFAAFLAKYVAAIFLPILCLIVLFSKDLRFKGLLSFILPLCLACAGYYLFFANDLNALLQFSKQYQDLKSDDFLNIYVWSRPEMLVLLLVGYWGLRQAFRDNRLEVGLLLWAGVIAFVIFQIATRADYDYWKHSIYLIILLAPLAGWLWSDWSWWDEPNPNPSHGWLWKKWQSFKERNAEFAKFEAVFNGGSVTEKPGSYSLMAVLALLLVGLAVYWSQPISQGLLGYWPSYVSSTDSIVQAVQEETQLNHNSKVLIDDSAVLYYLYGQTSLANVTTPFFNSYKNLSGLAAYTQAIKDHQFGVVVLDGGVTPQGTSLNQTIKPLLSSSAYKLVYRQPFDKAIGDNKQQLEIYELLTKGEQSQIFTAAAIATPGLPSSDRVVTPPSSATPVKTQNTATVSAIPAKTQNTATVSATPAPPTATVAEATAVALPSINVATTAIPVKAPVYPTNPAYDFSKGDQGWGALPQKGGLEPGTAVVANTTYQLLGHASLKFTPKPDKNMYTVGVNRQGAFKEIQLYAFVPAENADAPVRVGLYYFDTKWGWHDDGFQTMLVPGQWTELTLPVPDNTSMQQFGLKLVGYSGSVYISGVSIQ